MGRGGEGSGGEGRGREGLPTVSPWNTQDQHQWVPVPGTQSFLSPCASYEMSKISYWLVLHRKDGVPEEQGIVSGQRLPGAVAHSAEEAGSVSVGWRWFT